MCNPYNPPSKEDLDIKTLAEFARSDFQPVADTKAFTTPSEILSKCRCNELTVGLDEKVICIKCRKEFPGIIVKFNETENIKAAMIAATQIF